MCALAAVAQLNMPATLAQAANTIAASEKRVRELEQIQQQLLERVRKQHAAAAALPIGDEDAARRQRELDEDMRQIEERIAQEKTQVVYTPSTRATPEMRAYYKRLVARVEDCGTRHFPKRGEKSVYGKGVVSIELDHEGNAVTMKIERSSADEVIDNHMLKLIAASAPFGPTPQRVRQSDQRRYDRLVVFTGFAFKHDNKTREPLDASEQCKW